MNSFKMASSRQNILPGIWTTRVVDAFVNILASNERISRVSRFAETFWRVGRCTFGVEAAAELVARALAKVAIPIVCKNEKHFV